MRGDPELYRILDQLGIRYDYYEHPAAPTIGEALKNWKDIDSTHCKNIFLRNHKGDRHYLVILEHVGEVGIHDLEKRLKQGKLSFASGWRLEKYLGLQAGSVSIFGLIHDIHIDDDGLVRQLVTADNVSEEVMRANRERRIVPV